MTRNVVRSLHRRGALATWRSPSAQSQSLRRYSEASEQPLPPSSASSSNEETLRLLRVADQKFLRECKGQADDFINHIKKAKKTAEAIPLTVQANPGSKIPPYQLGYPRTLFQKTVSERADRTIEAAQTIKEHLIDLQYAPYEDKAENPLVKFEKDIEREGWTREKKEAQSKEWEFQLEAQLPRLTRSAKALYEDHQSALGRMRSTSTTPSFQRARDESSSEAIRGEERAFKDARKVERPSRRARDAEKQEDGKHNPPALDLKALQNQLADSINKNPK